MSAASPFVPAVVRSDFGQSLRHWRGRRSLSQLQLSVDSGISQRHISFMESGRAQPSREMVLKLGLVLDVPLRQRNLMLLAAGYAPLYRERSLSDPELQPVRQALEHMLGQQEPFPAVVVDRLWNLVMANGSALRLLDWLLGPQDRRAPALRSTSNLVTMMLHPQGLRPLIANWEQVAADQLQLIHRESLIEGGDGAAGALLAHLLSIEGVPADWRTPNLDARHLPFMPLRLRRDDTSLELFTTISTLGTPHDVTLHELRIESFFPADPVTAEWFKLQALGAPGADG
ncbi:MAG TPA: helix-turn-helix transcriptional regulator [Burkholderiaceae bacterium]|nr:helix-turn-helix transcriptional regulator [Burkholderiaceae bacterium]